MNNSPFTLSTLTQQANQLTSGQNPYFSDFSRLFEGFNQQKANELFNSILEEILLQKMHDKKPAYSDQIHLIAAGDFNLTLNVIGQRENTDNTLCASEFNMMVINMLPETVAVPRYETTIRPSSVYNRPAPLKTLPLQELKPYTPTIFQAYKDIAVLDEAALQAPCLIIYSRPLASVTWVFDRNSLEPLMLTDNSLQRSRILLAVRILGELGEQHHIDTLDSLSRSDFDYFVRWEAAESVYKLDEWRGTRLLQEHLVHDNNPEIAKAAKQTLAMLSDETHQAEESVHGLYN